MKFFNSFFAVVIFIFFSTSCEKKDIEKELDNSALKSSEGGECVISEGFNSELNIVWTDLDKENYFLSIDNGVLEPFDIEILPPPIQARILCEGAANDPCFIECAGWAHAEFRRVKMWCDDPGNCFVSI